MSLGIGIVIGIRDRDWILRLVIGIRDLDWGLRLGVGDLNQELGLINGNTIDEEWGLK